MSTSSPTIRTAVKGDDLSLSEAFSKVGWGKCLITWYEVGLAGKTPDMPLAGFKWDYSVRYRLN